MKKIVVYTCIYGNYDQLGTHMQQDVDCDYICFTDNPTLESKQFRIVNYQPISHEKANLYLGFDKSTINPINYNIVNTILCRSALPLLEPLQSYQICIYIDANTYFSKPDILSEALKKVENHLFIFTQHPWRNTIKSEALTSLRCSKFANTDMLKQIQTYQEQGYPDKGLYWNGFCFYLQPFAQEMENFYHDYTQELYNYIRNPRLKFHPQGQLALPYVLWKNNFIDKIIVLPPHYMTNIITFKHHG